MSFRSPATRALQGLALMTVSGLAIAGLAGCTGSGASRPTDSGPPEHSAASASGPPAASPTITSASSPDASPATPTPSGPTYLVGLGDSVATGNACGCTDFVHLFGQLVQQHTGRPNHTDNLAVDGNTTSRLQAQLDDPAAQADLARADLVVVMIGANDLVPARTAQRAGTCGGADEQACARAALAQLRVNLGAVLRRVGELTAGHRVGIRVADYWNAFQAGEVAREKYGAEDLAESEAFTRSANAVTCQVASAAGDTCVDTYTPFLTATADGDPTSLLVGDGDHPNQAGQWVIARALAAAGFDPL